MESFKEYIELIFLSLILFSSTIVKAQKKDLIAEAKQTMLKATKYMVNKVSTNGGYVRLYTADLSHRWGGLEAYKCQIWMAYGFTPKMGETFLDAYNVTGNEYYYHAAEGVAKAVIWGQLPCGGWDYIVDFAGDPSLKEWYKTIGKNAWGWDEYQHYYENATFKNCTTTEAARFLLRLYLEKLNPTYKPALEKAIDFVLKSQYPLGGWPQRYPQRIDKQFDFSPQPNSKYFKGKSDYTSFYINNDELTWDNIQFLIQCYVTLGEERFLDPIRRGMNFYLITQLGNPQGGWAQQYNMELRPAHGRKYEPAALMTKTTYLICKYLIRFYRYTGDRKFLARIPDAIQWLESVRLPKDETKGGKYNLPLFVEVGTNKAIYVHRKGTGIENGEYWIDYKDDKPLKHYGSKIYLNIKRLKNMYEKVSKLTPEEATNTSFVFKRSGYWGINISNKVVAKKSPLKAGRYEGNNLPQDYFDWALDPTSEIPDNTKVKAIVNSLDNQDRWLSMHNMRSPTYAEFKTGKISYTDIKSTGKLIRDPSDQKYISTGVYEKNMHLLLNYILKQKQ